MKSTRKRREGVREKNSWVVVQPRDYALESELFISELSRAVVFTEYDDDPVEMHGRDCLEPLSSFEDVQLATVVAENVALAGFIRPTPVQKYSIPVIEAGRDLMASARTGSGKTAAFLLPIFSHLIKNAAKYNKSRVVAKVSRPVVLVLSPTRELAYQIYEHCRRFLYRCAIRPGVVYGGTGLHTQIRMLEEGCDVLVGTPGRLRDLLQRKVLELAFVRFLVLDEADRMLDMGFEPQIRALVEEEDMTDKFARQTLMFSATLPKHLQVLASDFMKEHIYLSVGGAGSSRNILQTVKWVENENKQEALLDLLDAIYDKDSLILVFADTKATVRQLNDFLLRGNYRIVSMHGDLSQREREKALKTFKLGKAPILVATAVCSRGLHIHNIKHVINYDFPRDIDEYTHRIGRTGRIGTPGAATSFFNYKNRTLAKELLTKLKSDEQEIPSFLEELCRSRDGSGKNKNFKLNERVQKYNGYHARSTGSRFRQEKLQNEGGIYNSNSKKMFSSSPTVDELPRPQNFRTRGFGGFSKRRGEVSGKNWEANGDSTLAGVSGVTQPWQDSVREDDQWNKAKGASDYSLRQITKDNSEGRVDSDNNYEGKKSYNGIGDYRQKKGAGNNFQRKFTPPNYDDAAFNLSDNGEDCRDRYRRNNFTPSFGADYKWNDNKNARGSQYGPNNYTLETGHYDSSCNMERSEKDCASEYGRPVFVPDSDEITWDGSHTNNYRREGADPSYDQNKKDLPSDRRRDKYENDGGRRWNDGNGFRQYNYDSNYTSQKGGSNWNYDKKGNNNGCSRDRMTPIDLEGEDSSWYDGRKGRSGYAREKFRSEADRKEDGRKWGGGKSHVNFCSPNESCGRGPTNWNEGRRDHVNEYRRNKYITSNDVEVRGYIRNKDEYRREFDQRSNNLRNTRCGSNDNSASDKGSDDHYRKEILTQERRTGVDDRHNSGYGHGYRHFGAVKYEEQQYDDYYVAKHEGFPSGAYKPATPSIRKDGRYKPRHSQERSYHKGQNPRKDGAFVGDEVEHCSRPPREKDWRD